MKHDQPSREDDASLEALLRQAGAREEPSPEMTADVRRAVHAEWLAVVNERKRRRTWIGFGLAASLAVAMLFSALILRTISHQPIPMATVAKVLGDAQLSAEEHAGAVREGEVVSVGDQLTTGARAQLALALGPNLSLRLDADSRIAVLARDRVALHAGAIYVDANPAAPPAPLTVETDIGSVVHFGTQFQVRDLGEQVAVSVREGRVRITASDRTHEAAAGERVHLAVNGAVERDSIASTDPSWRWASLGAPSFDIEGRPLAEFLAWSARETGRKLVYQGDAVQRKAAELRLRGSIAGLDPDTALAAVLATTPVQRHQDSPDALVVFLKQD